MIIKKYNFYIASYVDYLTCYKCVIRIDLKKIYRHAVYFQTNYAHWIFLYFYLTIRIRITYRFLTFIYIVIILFRAIIVSIPWDAWYGWILIYILLVRSYIYPITSFITILSFFIRLLWIVYAITPRIIIIQYCT